MPLFCGKSLDNCVRSRVFDLPNMAAMWKLERGAFSELQTSVLITMGKVY